jgi:aspartate ammonia-lyase
VLQIGLAVRANDMIVAECAAHGTLQINEFLPLIAQAMLESIAMLDNAAKAFAAHIAGISADADVCARHLYDSPTLLAAFIPHIDYEQASALAEEFARAKAKGAAPDLRAFLAARLGAELVDKVLSTPYLIGLGHKDNP